MEDNLKPRGLSAYTHKQQQHLMGVNPSLTQQKLSQRLLFLTLTLVTDGKLSFQQAEMKRQHHTKKAKH